MNEALDDRFVRDHRARHRRSRRGAVLAARVLPRPEDCMRAVVDAHLKAEAQALHLVEAPAADPFA